MVILKRAVNNCGNTTFSIGVYRAAVAFCGMITFKSGIFYDYRAGVINYCRSVETFIIANRGIGDGYRAVGVGEGGAGVVVNGGRIEIDCTVGVGDELAKIVLFKVIYG